MDFFFNSTQLEANKQNAKCSFFIMSQEQGRVGRNTPQASQAVLAHRSVLSPERTLPSFSLSCNTFL